MFKMIQSFNMEQVPSSEIQGAVSGECLVSGGMQQYLINQQNLNCQSPLESESTSTNICQLADCLVLHIFSYLEVRDLCVSAQVCRRWYSVASDEVLWRKILQRDINSWNVISHNTNPNVYKTKSDRNCHNIDSTEISASVESTEEETKDTYIDDIEGHRERLAWTSKEIYLQCSPLINQLSKKNNSSFNFISNIFRSFWPKKTPRLAMFGPGLETGTRYIVRKILECQTGLFTTVKLFPGQTGGVGSGFTMKMNNGVQLDLITLYSATKEERETRTQQQRAAGNKLLAAAGASNQSSELVCELQPYVKELCRSLDGFIFIIDATLSIDEIQQSKAELMAMIDSRWSSISAPVLVLSCVPHINSSRSLSCYQLIDQLNMQTLSRSFQVRSCTVDTMVGIQDGFHWLVSSCNRNKT